MSDASAWIDLLNDEDLTFLKRFVVASGSLGAWGPGLGPGRGAVVVVPGQGVDRCSQLADHLRRPAVLLRGGVLGEVAGDEDRVGPIRQPPERLDHRAQAGLGVAPVAGRVERLALGSVQQVEGGDLVLVITPG